MKPRTRTVVIGGIAALAAATISSGSQPARATPPSAVSFCTLAPAASSMAFSPALVSTFRLGDAGIEVLHQVSCDGRINGYQWLSIDDILGQ